MGPFTFVAVRFLISALFVLPFVIHERGLPRLRTALTERKNKAKILILSAALTLGVLLQQYGLGSTSVTHTAFLTGLYVVMVPIVGAFFYDGKLTLPITFASLLSVFGVWLLSGGNFGDLRINFFHGDALVLLCAFCFAIQVIVTGKLSKRLQLPFSISFIQYLAVTITACVLAFLFESFDAVSILKAWLPLLFAGVASGGIAYTLQAVAQQHTPSADAAIILSTEALFGGVGGVWLLKEKLTTTGILGCFAILAAIILVEAGPLWSWGQNIRQRKSSAKKS